MPRQAGPPFLGCSTYASGDPPLHWHAAAAHAAAALWPGGLGGHCLRTGSCSSFWSRCCSDEDGGEEGDELDPEQEARCKAAPQGEGRYLARYPPWSKDETEPVR